jgi:hypothetical protein
VNEADAIPEPFVATVIVVDALLNRPLAPEPGAVNVTFTPLTGLFPASRTVTDSAVPNAVEIAADCGVVPAFAVIDDAAPAVFVKAKFNGVRAPDVAVTLYGPPAVPFAVNEADAIPEPFVATVIVVEALLNNPLAPEPGAVNVTFTPLTGLFPASRTVTDNAVPNAVEIAADCGVVPAFAVIDDAAPAVFVSAKFTGVSAPDVAVTLYGPPAVPFAVNEADAIPEPFVATVIVVDALLNRPLAPAPGAVNVTFTPLTGLFPASRTVTDSAVPNAVEIAADCGVVPAFAVIEDAAPAVFVKAKFTAVSAPDVADTLYGPPDVPFAVNGAEAMPDAFVATVMVAVALLNVPLAPEPGAVNVTFTPLTGLLPASLIVTERAVAKAVLIAADCGVVPAFAVIDDAAPAVFVKAKFNGVSGPDVADTLYGPPAVPFAVNGADAMPDAFVATVMVAVALLNVPLAPDPGAVNVTFTPLTGLLPASFTVTAKAFVKAVFTAVDCGVVPAFAVIVDAVPAVFVKAKFNGVSAPEVATTL